MRGAVANGKQIRTARLTRGLTQEEVAALADLDVKTVRKAEQGQRLDLGPLTRLAHVLQTDVSQLIRPIRPESDLQARRHEHVLRWNRTWEARDGAALAELYHEHAVLHLPGGPNIPFGGTFRGRDEIRRANETAWSTCRTEPSDPDDYSVLATDDSGILQGMMGVHLPNGEIVRLWCLQVFTFEGDLIANHRVEYDTLNFARLLQFPMPQDPPGEQSESSR